MQQKLEIVSYLDMSFVNVGGICELSLFADNLAENNVLLEEENLPFLPSIRGIR